MIPRREILNGARTKQIKQRRKRIFFIKLYIALFLLVALIIGLAFLSRNQKLLINKVNIAGNNVISTEDLLKLVNDETAGSYLFVFPKKDVFLYPQRRTERKILENFERISEAKIKVNNLTEITITVKEREGKYLWCKDKCYFADEGGYIFDQAPDFSGNSYFKFLGGLKIGEEESPVGEYILPAEEFARLSKFSSALGTVLLPTKTASLEIAENGDYKLSMEGTDGKIIFKKENNFDKLLENFDSALKSAPLKTDFKVKFKSLLYIDLRFDNKVYFKFQ